MRPTHDFENCHLFTGFPPMGMTKTEWEENITKTCASAYLKGKKVALFGTGDQSNYYFLLRERARTPDDEGLGARAR